MVYIFTSIVFVMYKIPKRRIQVKYLLILGMPTLSSPSLTHHKWVMSTANVLDIVCTRHFQEEMIWNWCIHGCNSAIVTICFPIEIIQNISKVYHWFMNNVKNNVLTPPLYNILWLIFKILPSLGGFRGLNYLQTP